MLPFLQVQHLTKTYPLSRWRHNQALGLQALCDVSFTLERGATLAICGRTGSGKSTLARCVAQLEKPTSGTVLLRGEPLQPAQGVRGTIQLLFQGPSSLNPRWPVARIVEEPLDLTSWRGALERRHRVREVLAQVQLGEELLRRRPDQLSGGQCHRVALARALAHPDLELLILDEPLTGLDTPLQLTLLALLEELRKKFGLTLIYITHDLETIGRQTGHVLVLDAGQAVEYGPVAEFFSAAQHPASQLLLRSALPRC